MVSFRPRLPDLKGSIDKLIPEVRRRNQYALLHTSGESTLLYLPNSIADDSNWDDVRQTYRSSDKTYQLYLNRFRDSVGNRLYTNDVDIVPSILVAYPSNPDSLSAREEGVVLSSRSNSWTLWDPYLPLRGALLCRLTTEREWWLIENVLYSYFPNASKTQAYLLHQEMQLSALTDDNGINTSQLPSVEDALSLYTNSLTYTTKDADLSGTWEQDLDGVLVGSGTVGITIPSPEIAQNAASIELHRVSGSGRVSLSYGVWSDATSPVVYIDPSLSQLGIKLNPTTTLLTKQLDIPAGFWSKIKVKIANYVVSVYLNEARLLSYDFKRVVNFSTLQPLTPAPFQLTISSGSYKLRNLYLMENL